MIVRLKDYKIFSFYMTEVFQFYDSPIKSEKRARRIGSVRKFQFYDSPIKSKADEVAEKSDKGFNSMIVRLKEYDRPL